MSPDAPDASQARPLPLSRAEDWVDYAVGLATFRGRTTVRVQGDGRASVTFERGDQVDRYEGQLDEARFGAVRQMLARHDLRAVVSTRTTALPDEPRVEVTLNSQGNEVRAQAWQNDQWSIPPLRALVKTFEEVARQISGGRVAY